MSFTELQKQKSIIDTGLEAKEFAAGKDYFVNTEFLGASTHFKKALAANKNSYLSQYFASLCDIYLNEGNAGYGIMEHAVETIKSSLILMSRSNIGVTDKLNFITAILVEMRIIIISCIKSRNDLYDVNISEYRKKTIADLRQLLPLFEIDSELIMMYTPAIANVLTEIADCAIAACHKAVQTVAVGIDIFAPSDYEYKQILSLCNSYCFFATSLCPDYDAKKYVPDFTQNNLLNDKVMSRFAKFDEQNKANAKKYIIGDIDEYDDISAECEKAVFFTEQNCFRAMCDVNYSKRATLLSDGLHMICRLLTPRVTVTDKKKVSIKVYDKFSDIVDKCASLSRFLNGAAETDVPAEEIQRAYYAKLLSVVDMYFYAEYNKYTKFVNKLKETRGEDYKFYEKFLFDVACCCVPAFKSFVAFSRDKDKNRGKLVKIAKQACEEFLMLWDYRIDNIDQSGVYRPILDIYNAVLKEFDD